MFLFTFTRNNKTKLFFMVKFINKDGAEKEVTDKQWEAIFQHVKSNKKVGGPATAKKKSVKVADDDKGGEA